MSFVIAVSLILYLKILLGENKELHYLKCTKPYTTSCVWQLPSTSQLPCCTNSHSFLWVENLNSSIRKVVFWTSYSYLAYHLCLIKKDVIKIHQSNISTLDATHCGCGSSCSSAATPCPVTGLLRSVTTFILYAAAELFTCQLWWSSSRHHLRERKALSLYDLGMTVAPSSSKGHTKEFLSLELAFPTLFMGLTSLGIRGHLFLFFYQLSGNHKEIISTFLLEAFAKC